MCSAISSDDLSAKRRSRGRPSKNKDEQAKIRNRLLNATAEAYAESGYHGLSVQAILKKAQLSRPTFYRQFNNLDEPLRVVIARAHQGLVDRLLNQIPADATIQEKITRAVDLYLEWTKSIGPLLRPFYIELHDPCSPVSELRPQVLAHVAGLYRKTLEMNGIQIQNPLLVEVFATAVEFLGYRYHLQQDTGKITPDMMKGAILNMMACTVAEPEVFSKPAISRDTEQER